MLTTSCFIQLAAMVVTFRGPKSMVNITSPGPSDSISSMVIQFKTSQLNAQIVAMMSDSQSFAVNIRSGLLNLEYNFNKTGNGTINLVGFVNNTNKWFILNITSLQSSTHIRLTKHDNSISMPCELKLTPTEDVALLGQEFSELLKTSGLKIGGTANDKSLTSFKGCIGLFSLNNRVVDLLNMSKASNPFKRVIMGTKKGCQCSASPCVTGAFVWDRTKGKCDCTCSIGYHGVFCQNRTMSKVDEDDLDSEFIYIVAGVSVGVFLLLICVICVVVYIKRTSSSVFGVYNPKRQELTQGQKMNTAFTLPIPEKLI